MGIKIICREFMPQQSDIEEPVLYIDTHWNQIDHVSTELVL